MSYTSFSLILNCFFFLCCVFFNLLPAFSTLSSSLSLSSICLFSLPSYLSHHPLLSHLSPSPPPLRHSLFVCCVLCLVMCLGMAWCAWWRGRQAHMAATAFLLLPLRTKEDLSACTCLHACMACACFLGPGTFGLCFFFSLPTAFPHHTLTLLSLSL